MLAYLFEMGLFPNVLDEVRAKGIDIAPKYIPADVCDKRAVEKNQVVFHDVAAIEVKPLIKANIAHRRMACKELRGAASDCLSIPPLAIPTPAWLTEGKPGACPCE